jgi:methyl-accepting chemotaxis protein
MQLKHKLPLILFVAYVGVTGTMVGFALLNSSKQRAVTQYETAKTAAHDYADNVKAYFSERIVELQSVESGIAVMANLDDKTKAENISALLRKLSELPSISDAYAVFERGAYFGAEGTKRGFYYNIDVFHPLKGGIETFIDESYEVKKDDDWYNIPKKTKGSHLTEPYKWTYPGEAKERKMVSLSYPIFVKGEFIGVLGLDMELSSLEKEFLSGMDNEKKHSYVVLVSNEGIVVAHPKPEMILASIDADTPEKDRQRLKDAIKKGEYCRVIRPEKNEDNTIISYVPMLPSGLEIPWSMSYAVPHSVLRGDELSIRYRTIAQLVGTFFVWGIFLIWLMSNIFGNITRAVEAIGKMTEGDGDLTIKLAEGGKDEIGQMSRALNIFIEKLRSTIKTSQLEAKSLLNTSSTLYGLSRQLSSFSKAALAQSNDVSSATESASSSASAIASDADKTSTNSHELAGTAEQMSLNMNSVAGAVEELSASFSQITKTTDDSRYIAAEATKKAAEATEVMNKLGVAAKEIGQVTDVIKKIADKTNLLALNATIEAASAGEAGKGFAVVAGEIKELANQSAESADDITNRVDSIQSGTSNAINVIRNVSNIIGKINASIDSIANNVAQQTVASNEIANNAEHANAGAKQVVKSIGEVEQIAEVSAGNASSVADEAKNISGRIWILHEDAEKSEMNSSELESTADSLKTMAEHLNSILSKFKI